LSEPVWPQAFPGGVADAAGRIALWRDAQGRMVALSLAEGRALWRSELPLRPLFVTDSLALGLALAPPRVVAHSLPGGHDAEPVWVSAALPWPGWAAAAGDETTLDLTLDAARIGELLILAWQLRQLSAGGAPPGPGRDRPAPVSGSCALALADGTIQSGPSLPPRPVEVTPFEAVDDPSVVAQCRLGALRYRLAAVEEAGTVKTTLRAIDAQRGTLHWERVLDETPRRSPMALRPGA
jgi:hypothetical protein